MKNLVLIVLILISCQPTKINQYVKVPGKQLRHGLWIEKENSEFGEVVEKGKYDHGEKIGTWKTTVGGKRFQKDVIKNGITKTKIYHPNGKLMKKGQSRTEISLNQRLWYKFGEWKYFDKTGKLIKTRDYDKIQDSIKNLK